ncbi:MAG: hypothetical protein UHS47_11225, partial [Oscillospiraceae bacterium]|nr:hypothetical protein [Oscillospiraceae bacterium]
RKSNISARIPLQPQCAHWGSFPSGEAIAPSALSKINYNLRFLDKTSPSGYDKPKKEGALWR